MSRAPDALNRMLIAALSGGRGRTITDDGTARFRLRRARTPPPPARQLLPRGSVHARGAAPLSADILCERGLRVRMRDGVHLTVDALRPASGTPVPAIISWGPYGRQGTLGPMTTAMLNRMLPRRLRLSGLQLFENIDPAYWVPHGYAVIQPDIRGIGSSEGHFQQWGAAEGRDGHDLIEWLARQPWCTGRIALAGNSWSAISQWFIAAERPAHLSAFAPWEGAPDPYRNHLSPGGIPTPDWQELTQLVFRGREPGEDLPAMLKRHPLVDAYWREKTAGLSRIRAPLYAVGSYTNKVHSRGFARAYAEAGSKHKWLRIHDTHEWEDFYTGQDELRRFFDHVLKEAGNGWERTPRVRFAILDPGGANRLTHSASRFPPARAQELRLHLAPGGTLSPHAPRDSRTVSYRSDDGRSGVAFTHRFEQDTLIAGPWRLLLWIESDGAEDADVFLRCQKLDAEGRELPVIVHGAPYSGRRGAVFEWGHGMLRASRRELSERSTRFEPVHTYTTERPLQPGSPVLLEIAIPPMVMRWRPGEQLRLRIAGYEQQRPEFPFLPRAASINRGRTIVRFGGRFSSCLIAPVLPPPAAGKTQR